MLFFINAKKNDIRKILKKTFVVFSKKTIICLLYDKKPNLMKKVI